MTKKGLLTIGFLALFGFAAANITDTIIALEPVVAKGVKFEHVSVGAKLAPIDSFQVSMYQMQSVAELFAAQSMVAVSSYGPGSQSGIKIRGGNADHTTIVWNGLNLKPPMSGELNYSNVLTGAFDQVEIQPGGSSTMYGTGAATGVVFLSNKINLNNQGHLFKAGFEGGSFNTYGINGDVQFVKNKTGSRIFIGHQHSDNNFNFTYNKDITEQKHAAHSNTTLIQQNTLKLSEATQLETDIWYSYLHKKIPNEKSDSEVGRTEQTDQNFNFAINIAHYLSRGYIKYRGGVIWYYNNYLGFDTTYYTAINRSNTFINEIESKYNLFPNHSIFLGVNHTYDKVYSDSYTHNATRNQLDIFSRYALQLLNQKIRLNIEGRQAITDGDFQPFIFSGGAEYQFVPNFTLKFSAAKLYTLPDLNDLYWGRSAFAEGNPDLSSEFGWNAEIGISELHKLGSVQLKHELTAYQNVLNMAIVWLPDSASVWKPVNVEGTKTTGLEFAGNTSIGIGTSKVSVSYSYAYTEALLMDSTKRKSDLVQKRYVPKHKAALGLTYQYKAFSAAVFNQYVGKRYIDDVSLPLDPYYLVDLYFNYAFRLKKTNTNIYFKIKNLLDVEYEIIKDFAQPSQSFYIGTNIKF